MQYIINYVRAIIRLPFFLKAVLTSKPASLDTAKARLQVCSSCDRLDILTRQCRECWCFIRMKVQWLDEICPLKKW